MTSLHKKLFLRCFPIESVIWIAGLLYLAFSPTLDFSCCLFKNLGLPYCPGCGLGHAIHYLFHGEVFRSLQAHPLGIPTMAAILYRIFTASKFSLHAYRTLTNYF